MKKIVQKIVVAGIIAHEGKILIIQRSADDDVFPNLWEIPSGKREPFETSHNALVRETKEEVGIDVEPIMPVDVFEFKIEKEDEIRDATQISFLCRPIGEPKVKLSDEHQNFVWIDEKELDSYFNLSDETRKAIEKAFELLKSKNLT